MIDLTNVVALTVDGDGTRHHRLKNVIHSMRNCFDFHNIKVFSTDSRYDNICDRIDSKCDSIREYNHICLFEMNDHIDTDYCMIFHDDGFPLFPKNWTNDFLSVDYIGAPWEISKGHTWARTNSVGNGGFSIRSKRLMDYVQFIARKKGHQVTRIHEDGFICVRLKRKLEKNNCVFSDYELAKRFSVETLLDNEGIEVVLESFGFHDHNKKIVALLERSFGDVSLTPDSIFTIGTSA